MHHAIVPSKTLGIEVAIIWLTIIYFIAGLFISYGDFLVLYSWSGAGSQA